MKDWKPDFEKILLFDAELDLVKVLRRKLIELGIFSENITATDDKKCAIRVVRLGVGNVLSGVRLPGDSTRKIDLDLLQEYLNYILRDIKLVLWVADIPQTKKLINKFSEQIKNRILILPKQGGINPGHFSDFVETNFPRLLPDQLSVNKVKKVSTRLEHPQADAKKT